MLSQMWTVLFDSDCDNAEEAAEESAENVQEDYCQLFADRAALTLSLQCGSCHER
jgi:hypothetical protein